MRGLDGLRWRGSRAVRPKEQHAEGTETKDQNDWQPLSHQNGVDSTALRALRRGHITAVKTGVMEYRSADFNAWHYPHSSGISRPAVRCSNPANSGGMSLYRRTPEVCAPPILH